MRALAKQERCRTPVFTDEPWGARPMHGQSAGVPVLASISAIALEGPEAG